ncbi:MAG: UDP-glucose/GDP-mannose dehydrogenase family protein [Alphaproteobacteria bacterium]|nr:UDP-glucose/GDP-mannose dehydrogenase family protein [Alphaproteobacteria bacterium]
MRIAMIGAGYVGQVSGACFASFGHLVVCVDTDADKVARLQAGETTIFEPGLAELMAENGKAGRLEFTTDLEAAVRQADVVFIAVGTPARRSDGHADLEYVYEAARRVAGAISGYTVIVTKSTVPVGTGDEVMRIVAEAAPNKEFSVVSNPEFLREGAAIDDFKRPDRVVIGVEDERAKAVMAEVYRALSLNQSPVLFTSRRNSELIKYAGNAFLAMKITFINEIADLSEKLGTDVQEVARGIGMDRRIGPKFLNAGPGYGGSCFPKDTLALTRLAKDANSPVRLIETTIEINDARKGFMAERVIGACGGDVTGKTIGILGLTFKPNTDDMREAPSLAIIDALQGRGAKIQAFDPEGMTAAAEVLNGVDFADDPYGAAAGAAALVIITEWDSFRSLDFARLAEIMERRVLVDLRNI